MYPLILWAGNSGKPQLEDSFAPFGINQGHSGVWAGRWVMCQTLGSLTHIPALGGMAGGHTQPEWMLEHLHLHVVVSDFVRGSWLPQE